MQRKTDRQRDIEFACGLGMLVFSVAAVIGCWLLAEKVSGRR